MRALLWHRILGQSLCHTNPCRRSSPAYLTATLTTSTETKPPKKFKIPSRYDPYGPRPPPSEKIIKLAEEITNLPPEERKMIGPCLTEKLRAPRIQMISADAVAAAMPQGASLSGGAAKAEEKKAEKTVFNVKLEKFDSAAKIKVIKEVRAFTDLGLKEAKELVEKVPVVIKQGLTKEEADGIIEKIKAAGGVAVME